MHRLVSNDWGSGMFSKLTNSIGIIILLHYIAKHLGTNLHIGASACHGARLTNVINYYFCAKVSIHTSIMNKQNKTNEKNVMTNFL